MKNLREILLMATYLVAPGVEAAGESASPSMNSRCRYSLVTPRNASGVIFDESCTIAYVMPPLFGTAEIGSLARTTNLQFCSAVKNVDKVANQTIKSMVIIAEKIESMILAFEPLDQILMDMRLELATARSKMEAAKRRFEEAQAHLTVLGEAISKARQEHKGCVAENSAEDPLCLELKSVWEESKREAREFRKDEFTSKSDLAQESAEEFDIKASQIMTHNNRYNDAVAPMLELQGRMTELGLKTMELYREYTRLDGAIGQIIWTIHWDRLLEDYRRMNPRLPVNWGL